MPFAPDLARIPRRYATPLIACLAIATAMWFATGAYLAHLERSTEAQARAARTNLARSLAQSEEASVRAIDLSLVFLRHSWRRDPTSFPAAVAACEELLGREGVVQVAVLDRHGDLVYSRLPQSGRPNFADRDYFAFHQSLERDAVHVSAPVFGRVTGRWAIQFSRSLWDARGAFDGVVVMAVPPPALESGYQALDLGTDGVITLARNDGQVIARSSDLSTAAKARLDTWASIAAGPTPEGEFRGTGRLDGVERRFSYRKLQYGLAVLVGQSVAAVRAPYLEQRTYVLAFATAATLFLIAVAAAIGMRLRDKARFEERQEGLMLELHDGCIQAIYAIGLRLQSVRALAGMDADAVRRMISDAEADLNLVIQDLRAFIGRASPAQRTAAQFVEHLQRSIPATHRDMFRLDIDPDVAGALSPEKAEHVLRIAGEAASNVARHAGAQSARVSLSRDEANILLSIQDDGRGDAREGRTRSGLGLAHIKARARKLGGAARVESPQGGGTLVRVEFPA
jgi:signal transduction histidine kinase